MFKLHNKYTKTSYWLLAASSISGFIMMGMLLPSLMGNQLILTYIVVSVLSLMLLLNTYLAYQVFKKNKSALKWCLWLYGLQVVGFESANWGLSLTFGMQLTVTWSIGEANITFNLLAIVIWFVVYKALHSLNADLAI